MNWPSLKWIEYLPHTLACWLRLQVLDVRACPENRASCLGLTPAQPRSPGRNACLLLSCHLQEVSPTSPLKPKSRPVTHSPPALLISVRQHRLWDPHNCFDQFETFLSIREDPANNYSGTRTGVNWDPPRQTRTSSLPRLSTHSTPGLLPFLRYPSSIIIISEPSHLLLPLPGTWFL